MSRQRALAQHHGVAACMRRPFPSGAMLHGTHCPSTIASRRTTAHVKHEGDLERPLCKVKTPEPSLQPRSRGWPRPIVTQGSDWTVPHLYAPCYTARYLMFCQSPQTKSSAAALAHQTSHRNTFFSAPRPQ